MARGDFRCIRYIFAVAILIYVGCSYLIWRKVKHDDPLITNKITHHTSLLLSNLLLRVQEDENDSRKHNGDEKMRKKHADPDPILEKKADLKKTNEKEGSQKVANILQFAVRNSSEGEGVKVTKKRTINRHVKVPSKRKRSMNTEYMALVDIPGKPKITDLISVNGTESYFVSNDKNVSWLLDYALIGMAKTGTTALYNWLSPPLKYNGERCDLVIDDVNVLINSLYRMYQPDTHNNGLKCPQDISSSSSLPHYATYFPSTKLIVGIRHPIRWFESFYNYHSKTAIDHGSSMLPTDKLTKKCIRGSHGVCAWRAHIADFLSMMGKTPMTSADELDLLKLKLKPIPKSSSVGHVFLYDIQQLPTLSKDLLHFLNYPPVKHMNIPHLNKNNHHHHHRQRNKNSKYKPIDICNKDHVKIRQELLNISQRSSLWIRKYFLVSPDVHVSNKNQLLRILTEEWMKDPCNATQTT